jgi:hypothetical protein
MVVVSLEKHTIVTKYFELKINYHLFLKLRDEIVNKIHGVRFLCGEFQKFGDFVFDFVHYTSPHLLVRRGDVISDTFIASLSTW